MGKQHGGHNGVPWRSHEVSRIEALSDAVFAFAVTLLVVALEVPQTFAELWEKMHGFLAFAISFALLFQVWYSQHVFFRRYGLQDLVTLMLNGVLLFLVLFYMYPLKFLFAMLVSEIFGGGAVVHLADGRTEPMLANAGEAHTMMTIYAVGFGAIFLVFVLLYGHAVRKRHELELSDLEVFDAKASMKGNMVMVSVAALSLVVLQVSGSAGLSGMVYALTGIGQAIYWRVSFSARKRQFPDAPKR